MTASRRREIANEYAAELKKVLRENLLRVVLFGSVACGSAGEHSDTDVFILVKTRDVDVFSRVSEVAYEVDEKYNFEVGFSNIVHTPEQCPADLFLMNNIERDGVELYAA